MIKIKIFVTWIQFWVLATLFPPFSSSGKPNSRGNYSMWKEEGSNWPDSTLVSFSFPSFLPSFPSAKRWCIVRVANLSNSPTHFCTKRWPFLREKTLRFVSQIRTKFWSRNLLIKNLTLPSGRTSKVRMWQRCLSMHGGVTFSLSTHTHAWGVEGGTEGRRIFTLLGTGVLLRTYVVMRLGSHMTEPQME